MRFVTHIKSEWLDNPDTNTEKVTLAFCKRAAIAQQLVKIHHKVFHG